MRYWVYDADEKKPTGPFELEQLKSLPNFSPQAYVVPESAPANTQWKYAKDIPELAEFFVPPVLAAKTEDLAAPQEIASPSGPCPETKEATAPPPAASSVARPATVLSWVGRVGVCVGVLVALVTAGIHLKSRVASTGASPGRTSLGATGTSGQPQSQAPNAADITKQPPSPAPAEGTGKLQPLERPLLDFEQGLLPDSCKLGPKSSIEAGVFKGYAIQDYDCSGVHHLIVVDGDKLLKYTNGIPAFVLKDPGTIAKNMDQVLMVQALGPLYYMTTTPAAVRFKAPKNGLLDFLNESGKLQELMQIPTKRWKACVGLGTPNTTIFEGHAYSCEIRDDIAYFSVAPEQTYLAEKALRLHGDTDASRNAVTPRALGASLNHLKQWFFKGLKLTRTDKVASGLFAGYDYRIYESHKNHAKVTVIFKGQKVFRIQYVFQGADGPVFFWHMQFGMLYAATTNAEFKEIEAHTLFGRMAAEAKGQAQQPVASWVAPSIEWAKQCASLTKEGAGVSTVKVEGFAYTCRIGADVQSEVVSENALEQ